MLFVDSLPGELFITVAFLSFSFLAIASAEYIHVEHIMCRFRLVLKPRHRTAGLLFVRSEGNVVLEVSLRFRVILHRA